MSAQTQTRRRRALAVAAVVSFSAYGILAVGAAANAAPIDPAKSGTITIHKYANPGDGATNPDGSGAPPTSEAIAGVTFEICHIDGVNLTDGTNAGWNALTAITKAEKEAAAPKTVFALAGHALSGCAPYTTDPQGRVTSAQLPVGGYLVREIDAPPAVISHATPFIVTIPTPAVNTSIPGSVPLDGDWVYDVHVLPKNSLSEGPRKNIVDQPDNGAALGAPIDFQVTTKIPALNADETYDKFIVSDTLDTKLTPNTDLSTVSVTIAGVGALTPNTDYTPVWNGQKLTVTFTSAGVAKLKANQRVIVAFEAKANAVGDIENTAYVNLNDYELTPGKGNGPDGSPTDVVETRWGNLTLKKINAAKATDGLAGAKFEIYMGTVDQAGCIADIATLAPVLVPGTTNKLVVESGTNGTISVAGLWVGDTEKVVDADGTVTDVNEPGHDYTQRCYVLKEIAAPAGYILPEGTAALTEVLVKSGDNGTIALKEIPNTQQTVPTLPFTGANGQLALTIGGIALVSLAIGGVLIVNRRRARQNH